MKKLRIILPPVVILVAVIGARAIIAARPEPESRAIEVPRPLVEIVVATEQTFRFDVTARGTVEPRTEITLIPEVGGAVTSVSARLVPGGFFREGEVLLEIDPVDYRAAVTQARSQEAAAELRLAQVQATAEVARSEWDKLGRGDGSPLALYEPQLGEARAALEAARAAREVAERNLERTRLTAPFDCQVRSRRIDVGQVVAPGAAVASLFAVDHAEVRLPIPPGELGWLDLPDAGGHDEPEPAVAIEAERGGRTVSWRGRIVRTEGVIDPATRVMYAVARIDDPYGMDAKGDGEVLPVGTFVTARITGREVAGVFHLPVTALRGPGQVVVIDEQSRAHPRAVEVLRVEGATVVVGSGLTPGERVSVTPLPIVTDGMRVRVAGLAAGRSGEGPA